MELMVTMKDGEKFVVEFDNHDDLERFISYDRANIEKLETAYFRPATIATACFECDRVAEFRGHIDNNGTAIFKCGSHHFEIGDFDSFFEEELANSDFGIDDDFNLKGEK